MLPCPTLQNVPHRDWFYSIKWCDPFVAQFKHEAQETNFLDLLVCEFYLGVVLSSGLSFFLNHVSSIVYAGAKKQMTGVYTLSVITVMAHHLIHRQNRVSQKV